jgi:large subunit ribosomal protein L25
VIGEAAAETLVSTEHTTLSLEAEATHLPDFVEVSVEGAEVGFRVLAGEVTLPSGSTLQTDPEALVVNVTAAPTAEEVEAELAEAEAEAGIEREATDEELEAAGSEATDSDGASQEAEKSDSGDSDSE